MLWIDDDYYEDLTYDSARAIIEALQRGEQPEAGSQTGRRASMAAGGKTTLLKALTATARRPAARPGRSRRGAGRKGQPEVRVKAHAVKTEQEGRPAHDIGDRTLAEPKDPDAR